ncbi:MAG: hypothetical protein ABIS03_12605, partial [Gemmatimonadaceae bacterium]
MKRYLLIGAVMQLCLLPSEARSQDTVALPTAVAAAPADTLRPRPRVRSVEYSDAYATRLKIHRLGSYAMLPLFATEYYLGEKIIEGRNSPAERNLHVVVAGGIGALFAVNTVTGV